MAEIPTEKRPQAANAPAHRRGSVAVITPTYDHGPSLRETVLSVLGQTREVAEHIVVSDGAPVDPAEFIGDLTGTGRVRIVYQPNGGAPAARNFGVKHTSADYLLFLDDDDIYVPDAVESLAKLLDEGDWVAAVGGTHFVPEKGRPEFFPQDAPGGMYFDLLLDSNQFLGGAIMFRREVFERAGGWREDLRAVEDYELMLRVSRLGPIGVHKRAVLQYREHEGSYTRRYTQLDYAHEVARTAQRLAGRGGRAAGARTRIFLMKFSLDEVFWQIRGDLRARRFGEAWVKIRRALNPVLRPYPSLAASRTWISLAARNVFRKPKKRGETGRTSS